jgi:hypothetical protein
MSDPSDDQPIAPPRSLAKPTDGSGSSSSQERPSRAQPQPAMRGQYSGSSSGSYSNGDPATERSLPVPPLTPTGATDGGTATSPRPGGATVDRRAEKKAERASKRAQASRPRTVRRAKLRLVRVDPWSVTKASFLLSIAFGIMCVVAVFLIFSIMSASGLWDHVNSTIQGVVDQKPKDAFDIKKYVGMSRVMGITMLISAIDVVIITALATLGAFIYNMSASLLGGVEVTLAEDLR